MLRILQSGPVLKIGVFSYSLYLVHDAVLELLSTLLKGLSLPPLARFAALLIVGVPAVIGVAYGFYLLVERHFVLSPSSATK